MEFFRLRLMSILSLWLLLVGLGLSRGPAKAAPQILRIDGSLFNSAGAPITGSRDIQIKAFDAATGGSAVWTSSVYNTAVASGRFSIALDATADTTSLTTRLAAKAASGEIWFEIHYDTGTANGSMDSDVTVAPRIRGKGTMFALVAAKADALTGVTATTLELNYLAGVTSNIQTQIANAGGGAAAGRVSKLGDSMSGALEVGSNITNTGLITSGTGYDTLQPNAQYKIGGQTMLSVGTGVGAGNLVVGGGGSVLTSGTQNATFGRWAGTSLTTGTANSLFGYLAGATATGDSNVFMGWKAGLNNTGSNSQCIGYQACMNSTGSYNTAMGQNAGYWMTAGGSNTLLGHAAGFSVSTQNYNTLIGYGVDTSSGATFHSVSIGAFSMVSAASAVQLGRGVNTTANSLQFWGYNFLNSSGAATFASINGVTAVSAAYLNGITSNLQAQINAIPSAGGRVDRAGDTMTGSLGLSYANATPDRAAYLDSNRILRTSANVSSAELEFVDGVTSNLGARVNLFTNTQAGYLGGVTTSLISQLGGLTANVQTQLNSTARLSGLVSGQVVIANGVSGVTTATGTSTDAVTWDATNKRLGVGTTSPSSTLDVRGQIRSVASGGSAQSNATAAIDWALGNVQIMTASCGPGTVNVTFSNMVEGGSYTLVVTGTTSGTCTFSQTSPNTLASSAFKFMPVNGDTAGGTTTVYTFSRAGNLVYVSWITGYN